MGKIGDDEEMVEQGKKCGHCGSFFLDDAAFCRRCGQERLVGDILSQGEEEEEDATEEVRRSLSKRASKLILSEGDNIYFEENKALTERNEELAREMRDADEENAKLREELQELKAKTEVDAERLRRDVTREIELKQQEEEKMKQHGA